MPLVLPVWRQGHMNLWPEPEKPCLETRWYELEIMCMKERVKRSTHAQIAPNIKTPVGLVERSYYSMRTWTSATEAGGGWDNVWRYTALCVYSDSLSLITHDVVSECGRWHLTVNMFEGREFPLLQLHCNVPFALLSEIIIWILFKQFERWAFNYLSSHVLFISLSVAFSCGFMTFLLPENSLVDYRNQHE